MNSEFDDEIEDMRFHLQHEHNYEKCITACEKLIAQLKENDEQYYSWACMHDEALCYRKLNNIDKSIRYANKAMLYDVQESEHIKTVWLMADNYVSKGKIKLAILFYLECVKYYRKTGLKRLRTSILFNIAKIKNKPLTMIKLLEIMKQDEDFTYKNMFQADVSKYNLLLLGYREFIEYCLEYNYKKYIFVLLNSINDKKLKIEVKNITNELECF